jgi:LysM repeat protein
MRSRHFVLPALALIAAVAAACAPLPALPAPTAPAPTAAPATTIVEPTATVAPVDLFTPVATEAMTPTMSPLLIPTAVVTLTAPAIATIAPQPGTATPVLEPSAAITPTQAGDASAPERVVDTYRDEVGGFEIDYPEGWALTDVTPQIKQESLGYSVTITSWQPQEPGTQGIPEGGSKVDIGVTKGLGEEAEAAATSRRAEIAASDPGSRIVFEEPWDLPGGLTGTHWTIETSSGETAEELVTAINGNRVVVSGLGNPALFEGIASTLRPAGTPASTAKEAAAPMVAAGAANESSAAAQALGTTTYTVRAGDTLAKIAARFGVPVSAILAANPQITNPDRIYIGQRLTIPTSSGGQPPTPAPAATRLNIYMIGLGGGNVGCGDQVVAVRRDVPRTAAPLTAALNLLLSQKSQYYGESGLYNALYQSDLRLASITRNGGAWTVNLAGTLRLGGVCDNPRVQAQLEQTALQFPTVKSVRYFVNGKPLESLLSGK